MGTQDREEKLPRDLKRSFRETAVCGASELYHQHLEYRGRRIRTQGHYISKFNNRKRQG